ncbi:MAG: methyltransferase domain-containing protein [Steroidobacteraceae bacterium]
MKITCLLATAAILAAPFSLAVAKDAALAKAIAAPHRSPDFVERDKARKPQEELEFFGIKPTLTVVEIAPGGGYWTEILAPYLQEKGTYYTAMSPKAAETFQKKLDGKPEVYGKVKITSMTEVAPAGTADLVLTFRNVHNWMGNGSVDQVFSSFFTALKPGGVLGVEEHRGSASVPQDPKAASGYVREDYTIQLAEKAGFKYLGKSEILANPKDTKDYPKGVWTLPPTLAQGDVDRAKYVAIGEADNFVLKFEKPKK